MSQLTLEHVLEKWEDEEYSVEKKLDDLRAHIFKHVGLKESPDYYMEHGKFFQRYLAGFICNYFWQLRDISFILLDPLHIFDILTTFAKEICRHPFQMLKQIWGCWTWSYTHGAFGLGVITAGALLACLIAGATVLLAGGIKAGGTAIRTMAKTVSDTFKGTAMGLPNNFINIGKGVKNALSSSGEFFKMIRSEPMQVLADAKTSLVSGVSYGRIRSFKFYDGEFLKVRGRG